MNRLAALSFWSTLLVTLAIASALGWTGLGDALWFFGGAGLVSLTITVMQRRQARAS